MGRLETGSECGTGVGETGPGRRSYVKRTMIQEKEILWVGLRFKRKRVNTNYNREVVLTFRVMYHEKEMKKLCPRTRCGSDLTSSIKNVSAPKRSNGSDQTLRIEVH